MYVGTYMHVAMYIQVILTVFCWPQSLRGVCTCSPDSLSHLPSSNNKHVWRNPSNMSTLENCPVCVCVRQVYECEVWQVYVFVKVCTRGV